VEPYALLLLWFLLELAVLGHRPGKYWQEDDKVRARLSAAGAVWVVLGLLLINQTYQQRLWTCLLC
jgi:hypothetical protein